MAQLGQDMPPPASISAQDTGSSGNLQITRQDPLPMYEFRQGVRASGKVVPTAWLDQDKSGNYKSKLTNVQKPRARRVKRLRRDSSLESTSGRAPNKAKEADHERRFKKPSSPDATSSTHKLPLNGESDTPSHVSSTVTPARYRQRNHRGGAHLLQDEASTMFGDMMPEDVEARSCKSCFRFGLPCSLFQEESHYPCNLCITDKEDCEPMREPLLKQSCLSCKKRRILCSFKVQPDRKGPCDSCINSSTHCVAGPLSRTSMVGPVDRNGDRLTRNIPRQQSQEPFQVKRTRRHLVGLQSRSIVPKFYGCRKSTSQVIESASFKDYDHVISRREVSSNTPTGLFRSIVTRFAHPISFNYESHPLELVPCHWCNDILYGLIGLGPVEVEVIDRRNGEGYKEIENGHACAGHMASRMCEKCTLARLKIAACTSHEVEPIEGVNPDAFTVSSFRHYLVPGMTEFALFDWCCICPTPASFHCLKPQEPEMLFSNTTDGCGLLLCERCASLLVGRYGGVLERLIDGLKLQYGESGLRADAEFLHPKGEILRRISYAGELS